MADLVDETVRGIRARLRELAPAVAEYERLEAAAAALGDPVERRGTGTGRRVGVRAAGGRSIRATSAREGDAAPKRARPRAKRGENRAAIYGVIAERPGVTVTEISTLSGIAKPLVYNATRAGVERGELERVALPGGQSGFRMPPA